MKHKPIDLTQFEGLHFDAIRQLVHQQGSAPALVEEVKVLRKQLRLFVEYSCNTSAPTPDRQAARALLPES